MSPKHPRWTVFMGASRPDMRGQEVGIVAQPNAERPTRRSEVVPGRCLKELHCPTRARFQATAGCYTPAQGAIKIHRFLRNLAVGLKGQRSRAKCQSLTTSRPVPTMPGPLANHIIVSSTISPSRFANCTTVRQVKSANLGTPQRSTLPGGCARVPKKTCSVEHRRAVARRGTPFGPGPAPMVYRPEG
jgi:hypothetical protein